MTDVIYNVPDQNGGVFRLQVSGANLELLRDNVVVDSRPLAGVTSFTINGADGDETLLVDQLISLPGGVFFNGGLPNSAPGDAIVIETPADSVAFTYTSTTDGRIVFESGGATSLYNFTGIDPLSNSGTVSDAVFTLPGGTDTQLEDDGTAGNNTSRLRDQNGGYETTTFTHPTHALTIDGTATDSVTVNLVDNLGPIDLTINAGTTTIASLGSPAALASITTDAAGTTLIANGGITTTGAQSYHDAVTLGATTALVSTNGGAISFDKTVDNAGFDLTVSTAGTATFAAAISGAGGFIQAGAGTTFLSGASTYAGPTIVVAGTLLVEGAITSATTVDSDGRLGGNGTAGDVEVDSGGTLAPGSNGAGILTTGILTFSNGAHFAVELGGQLPGLGGYDQVDATGTVTLNDAALDLSTINGFVPSYVDGDSFMIIDNEGVGQIVGTFAGLAEGAHVTFSGNTYVISYHGGDGNDVVLTAVQPNDPPVLSGPDSVIAAAGAAAIDLRLSASDPNFDPLTVTLSSVPSYGAFEYFDGASWVTAASGAVITAAELASLRYTPPTSGEHGGETLTYSVSDGANTVSSTIAFTVETDSPGPASLFFSAFGGPGNGGNPDLFTLDANLDPVAIPVNPPTGSFAGEHGGFFQYAGGLYFNAFTPATGDALFRMDANGIVTPVSDTANPGQFLTNQVSVDASYIEFAGRLYLRGDQLYQVNPDGTAQSIVLTSGHPAFFGDQFGGLIEFDHKLYAAVSATNSSADADLFSIDAAGNFTNLTNGGDGRFAGEDGGLIVFNNALYFNGYVSGIGDTLMRLDAGASAPVPVDPSGLILLHHPTTVDTSSAFHIYNDSLFFNEFSGDLGADTLFKLDSCGCLQPLSYGGNALQGAGALGGMVDFASSMFFVATTESTGTALFRMDSCGCISDVYDNGGDGAFNENLVSGFVQFNGYLYFDAYTASGDALFRLDPNGNLEQVDLGGGPGSTTLAAVNGGFKVVGDSLYFSAYTPNGDELVRIDRDGVVHFYDINPGAGANSFDPFQPSTNPDFGAFSLPVLHGTGQQDLIAGGNQNEVLEGLGGDDLLAGRGGNDILIGGGGADLFVFDAAGPQNVDRIMDYAFAGGDGIDLSALLDAHFTASSNIADFVRLIAVGPNLKLQIDADGPANGQSWSDVAILDGSNTRQRDEVTAFFGNAPHVILENDAFNLHTVALTGGGWVVTWTQTGEEDGTKDYNVYARVFDAAGRQITGTFEVSAANDMDDQNSIVTALSNGGFAVTWQSCADEILTRVFDANGHDAGTGVQPVITSAPSPQLAQVVALANGGYATVWSQDDGGDPNVYLNVFDAFGALRSGGPQLVNDANSPVSDTLVGQSFSGVGFGDHSVMVALQHGFAVMWQSLRDDGSGHFHENVFVRVFNFDGTPVTGEIQVNGPDDAVQDTPNDIVAVGGDNFAVQWESDTQASAQTSYSSLFVTSNFSTYAQLNAVRDDANVDPNVSAEPWHLAALKSGGYVSLWGQYDYAHIPNADVFIQVYDASGAIATHSLTGGIRVNDVSGVPNAPDQVVSLTGGGFVVMYDSTRDDGTGSGPDQDAYVRIYADDGSATTAEIRVNAANGLLDSAIDTIALPDGTFAVVWTQDASDGAHQDVLLQRFAADGAFFGPALLIGSTPFDSSDPQEHSFVVELRDSLSSNAKLLVAALDAVTFDAGADYSYPLDLHFVDLPVLNPPLDIAPVNTVPGAQSIEANTAAAIGGLSISDADAGSGTMTTTLSVAHGTLTVAALGGASVAGSGTSMVTINGTVAQVNATLGASNVVYQGNHDYFDSDTLTIVTNDNGNTGSGGPLTDTDQVAINLTTHLFGTPGDDTFTALPGNERIDALGGNDTINFNFRLVDAKVSYVGNTTVIDGPSGSHTVLTGFEIFKFTDGTVNNNDGDQLVDDLFYYSQYHDVWTAGVSADAHYHTYGWHEGRDPDAFFSTSTYLSLYPDVKAAGVDPLLHFDQSGWKEGRAPSIAFDDAAYLAANPDVAAAHVDPLAHFLQFGASEGRQPTPFDHLLAPNGFDYVYYLQHNPDVAAAHIDPFQHYETVGWKEGRNPNAYFDDSGYLAHYADVAAAGINPLDHYNQAGWKEGRDPSVNFDTTDYLSHYPDVAAAHVNPLVQFLQFGIHEGRSSFADGVWG